MVAAEHRVLRTVDAGRDGSSQLAPERRARVTRGATHPLPVSKEGGKP
jgi:hypothetical protein